MSKAITYRIKPSADQALKHLADLAGMNKSAYLSELVMSADVSELESIGGETRVARSYYWGTEPEDKLNALSKATGASRPDIVEYLIHKEAERFKNQ